MVRMPFRKCLLFEIAYLIFVNLEQEVGVQPWMKSKGLKGGVGFFFSRDFPKLSNFFKSNHILKF